MSIIHEKTPVVMAGVFLFSHIARTVSHTSRNIILKKIFPFLEIYWTMSHAARSADSCQCSRQNRYC